MTLSDIQPYTLPFNGVLLPSITISPEERAAHSAKPDATAIEFLRQLCRNGFKARQAKGLIPRDKRTEYSERVQLELKVIEELGFHEYILMIWDICRFADEKEIARGPGRGSVAGSLVCHLIGITASDPVKEGLFFTRFLSKARAKSTMVDGVRYVDGSLVPDVDMDFSYYRRQEVVDYLIAKYPGQTAKLLTTSTFTSKILIKDVLKVYEGANEDEAAGASDLISKKHGIPQEIEDALHGDAKWRDGDEKHGTPPNDAFVEWAKNHKEAVEIAMQLNGLVRSEGVHASALLICAYPIADLMPLQLSSEKLVISGYDMYSAQEVVLKFDLLGLKTLDVIKDVCDTLRIERDEIDINHPSIYRELQDFQRRYGIFQLETFAQGNAAAKVKPRTFDQLAAILAAARPGAIAHLDKLVKYVNEDLYNPVDPLVDHILKPTGGICLYQEQLLEMVHKLGMDLEECELLRRAVGKKDPVKVKAYREKIYAVAEKNGHSKELADLIWQIAEDSAGYSFNKSHSSSYAILTAITLFLKVNHPLHFYWALLRMARHESDGHEIVATIETEMRAHGFELLPPHLIESTMDFKVMNDREIRFSLGMLRGVSEKNMARLQTFQSQIAAERPTKFRLFEMLKQCGLSVGIGAALIQAGCMEGYEGYVTKDGQPYKSRSRLVLELLTFNVLTDKEKLLALRVADKPDVAHDVLNAICYLRDNVDEKGKHYLRAATAKMGGRFDTIKKAYAPYKEIYEMNRRNERLANYWYERTILGYSYSETLQGIFGEHIRGLSTVADAIAAPEGEKLRLIGHVREYLKGKTKKGSPRIKFDLVDNTGAITVQAFNQNIDLIEQDNGRLPIEGDVVVCKVKRMDGPGMVFVDTFDGCPIGIQTSTIFMRLSDLKAKGEERQSAV